jgi:hypothetical protein
MEKPMGKKKSDGEGKKMQRKRQRKKIDPLLVRGQVGGV